MRNRFFFLLDIVLLPLMIYISYVLRLETFSLDAEYYLAYLTFTFLTILIIPLVFWWMGIYTRYWRFASMSDLVPLIGTVLLSAFAITIINTTLLWLIPRDTVFPRSIPLIFIFLVSTATALPRFSFRIYDFISHMGYRAIGTPTLIVGAGGAGEKLVRQIQENSQINMFVVGFIDDDIVKHGMKLHGIPILGGRNELPKIIRNYSIEEVIIAIPNASASVIREMVKICESARINPKIIPSLNKFLDHKFQLSELRQVQIEDLLRREPVQTDVSAVHNLLRGRRVLITGAGGSIGSELCRQVLQCAPAELLLLGHGENAIFSITHELRRLNPEIPITPLIADVRFEERLGALFDKHRPQIVFHAAAHKHVPLMEMNTCEAITNNVLGTRNVLQAARAHGVEQFVMISTDKAVNPTSIMGASKRTAELLVLQTAQQTGLPYVAVRFGNVLGSRGSVVLTFQQQIAAGGPVTVTHPEMTRFFMTIPEAVQLVLQAAVIGRGGEIFVLDMGEPVKIVDLAHDLITLSGLEVGRDIEITYSGIRPGEKLYEELFMTGEKYQRTQHHKIFIAENASTLLNKSFPPTIEAMIESALHNDTPRVHHLLRQLIPEHQLAAVT